MFNWKRKGEKKECGPGGSSQAHPTTPQRAQGKANSQKDVIKVTPSGGRGQGSKKHAMGCWSMHPELRVPESEPLSAGECEPQPHAPWAVPGHCEGGAAQAL